MRMRRTLTKVLCVTLMINVTFLMFVVYSRYTRDARRHIRRLNPPIGHTGTHSNRHNVLVQKGGPTIPAYATIPHYGANVQQNDYKDWDGNLKYPAEYNLWRDWKLTLKKQQPPTKRTEPSQLFNVRKSQHGAKCAEFLRKPVWFVRPPSPELPDSRQGRDQWQTVSRSNKDYFVFSAYYDVKGTTFWDTGKAIAPAVRIIGVSVRKVLEKPLFCQMWFNNTDQLRIEQAVLSGIPESHDKNYTAVFFLCPLWIPGEPPYAVSLVTAQCSKPHNLMYVHELPAKQLPVNDFTVCVSPLNMRFNKVNELIQMIEFNRLFGADYFVFYNFSTGPNVGQVLNQYVEEGLVEVVQWHLPLHMDTWPQVTDWVEIHYFGQLAALNDCLYRNMHKSKFLVFSDMDELIVPRKHKHWSAMLDALPETSVYHFRCTFFRRDWAESPDNFTDLAAARQLKLDYLLTLDRETNIHPVFSRSKFILEPRKAEVVGIHSVWVLRAGAQREHVVDPYVGLLHHYRKLDYAANKTHDPSILRFAKGVADKIKDRWQNLQNLTIRQQNVPPKNDL